MCLDLLELGMPCLIDIPGSLPFSEEKWILGREKGEVLEEEEGGEAAVEMRYMREK